MPLTHHQGTTSSENQRSPRKNTGQLEWLAAFSLPFHPFFALLATIGFSFRGRHVWQQLKQQRSDLILWSLLAIVGIISVFGASDKTQGILNFFVPFLFIWLYALGRWSIQSPTRFLEAMIYGTATFASIIIIGRLFQLDIRIGDFIVLGKFDHRGTVLGMHSNGLAMVLEAGVIGGLGLAFLGRNVRQRLFAMILALLSLIATGITLSRGAMVGIAAGAFTLGLLLSPRVLALLGAGATGILGVSPRIRLRAFSIFDLARHDARLKIWHTTLRMLKDNLWFGVGPGNYGRHFSYYSVYENFRYRSAHNNYLYFTAAWGLIGGLLFFGWQIWVLVRTFVRGLSDHQKIMWAILITFGVHVLFDDLMTAYTAFLLGCLENPAFDRPTTNNATTVK